MSRTFARHRLLSAPRIGLAGLALAAILTTGAVAGGKCQDEAPASPVTAAAVVAPVVMPAPLAPVARAAVAPVAGMLDATLERLAANAPGLKREVLRLALVARDAAAKEGLAKKDELLTVIDYSLPSTAKRLWVFDVKSGDVLFNELVAHGKNTGDNYARRFSNDDGSLETSLGLFRTASTYIGGNGYSLRLAGLEPGFNDKAERRSVVMHGAPYVSEDFAAQHGRIGRSWGCPALSQKVAGKVIDTIKGGSLVFSYFPDHDWLSHSKFVGSLAATLTTGTN
jgi:L,D-transpeptidase catalytic domain